MIFTSSKHRHRDVRGMLEKQTQWTDTHPRIFVSLQDNDMFEQRARELKTICVAVYKVQFSPSPSTRERDVNCPGQHEWFFLY